MKDSEWEDIYGEFIGKGYSPKESEIMANAVEAVRWFETSAPPPVSARQAAEALNNWGKRMGLMLESGSKK